MQRRDLLRAGQTRGDDGLRQIEVQQQGKEQEEAGHLGGELPSVLEEQGADVGDVGNDGTIVGEFARLRRRTTLASRGQARAAEEAEEIRFADVEALALERGADVGQGGPLAAEFAGPLLIASRFGDVLRPGPTVAKNELTSGSRAKSRTIARTVST